MVEKDTVRLLRECDAGVKMGIDSIEDVTDNVKSESLRRILEEAKRRHKVIEKDIISMLDSYGDDGKRANPVARGMSHVMTEMKLVRLDTESSLSSYRVREKYTFGFTLAHGYFSDTIGLYDGHPTLSYDQGPTYVFDFKDETFTAPAIDDPDLVTYSFPMGVSGTLGGYGDSDFSKECDYVSINVEFVPYDGQPSDITPEHYFDCQLGRINLLSSTLFELDGNYYEIVRNADEWIFKIIEITLGINN